MDRIKSLFKKGLLAAYFALVSSGALANGNVPSGLHEMGAEMIGQERNRASEFLNANPAELKKRLQGSNSFNFEQIPTPSTLAKPDINKIAESWKLLNGMSTESTTKLKIFISFSMSDDSLRILFEQANLIGRDKVHFSVIGMLGKDNFSIQQTVIKIKSLTKGLNVDVRIDPEAFEKYQISQVPALVVYRDDPQEEARCIADNDEERLKELQSFIGAYGDVSIEFALEHLAKTEPKWKAEIETFLDIVAPRLSSYGAKS